MTAGMATCIGCGCNDHRACPEGCTWARVDYGAGVGVCSSCEEYVDQWDDGRRDPDLPRIHFLHLLVTMSMDNNCIFRATTEQIRIGSNAIVHMMDDGVAFPETPEEINRALFNLYGIYWRIAAQEYTAMHKEFDGLDGFAELNQVLESIFNSQA